MRRTPAHGPASGTPANGHLASARKSPIQEWEAPVGSDVSTFTARSDKQHGVARVALRGELDLATIPSLEDHLSSLEGDGVKGIILDLRDLTFIDSTGLQALLDAWDHAASNGHRLAIVGTSHAARKLLTITGTERILDEPAGVELLEWFTRGLPAERSVPSGDGLDRE
jgi:anti-anti-sigma factor